MSTCSLGTWDLDGQQEPTIRVGIVLPEDDMRQVRLIIPDSPYRVWLDDMLGQMVQSTRLMALVESDRVVLRSGEQVMGPASVIRLVPQGDPPLVPGAGVHVRGVMTGRGFHWQKRIHPSLAGLLEFRVHDGSLLVVNDVPLEVYLAGVLTSEMSGDCPVEFLKSQALVARSWVLAFTMNKHPDVPIDYCNDDDCQRYHGTTHLTKEALDAVNATRGQVLIDANREIIDANYAKACGGISETPENVWFVAKAGLRAAVDAPAGSAAERFFPISEANLDEYLTGGWLQDVDIFCSPSVVSEEQYARYLGKVDEPNRYFRWKMRYNREDLEQVLRDKFFNRQDPGRVAALSTLLDLRVVRRGLSGRAIELDIRYCDPMGQTHSVIVRGQHKIRDAVHEKFLYSSAFKIEIDRDEHGLPRHIAFHGAGWGHGVGMCQIGALGMALRGYDCRQIVQHYFEGLDIFTCY
jgi:SpoIID/LytB domain protein